MEGFMGSMALVKCEKEYIDVITKENVGGKSLINRNMIMENEIQNIINSSKPTLLNIDFVF